MFLLFQFYIFSLKLYATKKDIIGFETNITPGVPRLHHLLVFDLDTYSIRTHLPIMYSFAKVSFSHVGEGYSISKDFSVNLRQKKKKKSYNVRAYKLVTRGGVHFKDSAISHHIQRLEKLVWMRRVHKESIGK